MESLEFPYHINLLKISRTTKSKSLRGGSRYTATREFKIDYMISSYKVKYALLRSSSIFIDDVYFNEINIFFPLENSLDLGKIPEK